jgi:hypothetical protein
VSRLSRQCGILNISQLYRPARPVTGIALLFYIFYFYYAIFRLKRRVQDHLLCSEEAFTEPQPELDKSSQRPHILLL